LEAKILLACLRPCDVVLSLTWLLGFTHLSHRTVEDLYFRVEDLGKTSDLKHAEGLPGYLLEPRIERILISPNCSFFCRLLFELPEAVKTKSLPKASYRHSSKAINHEKMKFLSG
jgi:hypothetical protein